MPTTTTTTTTNLCKSYLWVGTSNNYLNELQYNTESAASVYQDTLNTPVDSILLAENENKMYVSTPDKLYIYAVDYAQSENQVKRIFYSTNSNRSLIDNYKNSYVWSVQAYSNKVVKLNPTTLAVVKEYSNLDAPFRIEESKYHNSYLVSGTHILWKIDPVTDIVDNIYSISGYSLIDFDVSESGVVCMLFEGATDNIVRVLKNDLYTIMFDQRISGSLRFCKYCNEGKFYFLSELNTEDSSTYSGAHYVYNSLTGNLSKTESNNSIVVTTTTTTSATTLDAVQIVLPNGGEQVQTGHDYDIKWLSSKSISDFVKIELYKGSSFNKTIVEKTENTGVYGWQVPLSSVEGNDYQIKVTWLSPTVNASNSSMSGSNFSILKVIDATTTTTTTTLMPQKAVAIDYDSEVNWVVVMLGTGSFLVFDLSDLSIHGLVETGLVNVVSIAARTAWVRPSGIQSKVRVFVGSQPYQSDRWDSGIIETTETSIYYGGGNNLKGGETYYVNVQIFSEQNGWSEINIKEFVMAK